MKSFVGIVSLIGCVMLAAPALAADGLMPAPVTDVMPPPVTDEPLPPAPAAGADLPQVNEIAAQPAPVVAPAPCVECGTAPRYDSIEVIKKIREIDRSRRGRSAEIADEAPRHDARPAFQARPAYRVRSDVTLVNFVVHRYRVISVPELTPASEVGYRPLYGTHRSHRVACKYGRYERRGSCRPTVHARG